MSETFASDQQDQSVVGLGEPALTVMEELLAYREAEEIVGELTEGDFEALTDETPMPDTEARVSEDGFNLIVQFETGGREYYERVLGAHPIWPKYKSGITLGFGYDIGYVKVAEFRRDWAELGEEALQRMEKAVGRHGGNTGAGDLRDMARQFRDIEVTWELSEQIFRRRTLPKFVRLSDRALPNTELLNGDCFGALVSLTFNRGPSYSRSGNRYREMREIKAAMASQRFSRIPGVLRRMSRVWQGTSVYRGLRRRRYAEAALFEAGLAAMSVAMLDFGQDIETAPENAAAEAQTFEAAAAPEGAVSLAGLTGQDRAAKDLWDGPSDEDFFVEETEEDLIARSSGEMSGADIVGATARSRVKWAPDDRSIDYAHLKSKLPDELRFEFTAADLELLCRLNHFPVDELDDTPVLFGLRGCGIISGDSSEDGEFRSSVVLKDQRPDHQNARCVMGVWKPSGGGTVSVFPGSTVPHASAVASWYRSRRSGNILPTGMYRYICGPHNGRPGCFLLRKTISSKRVVVVRRSSDDMIYEHTDFVHRMAPGDNIHPTFSMSHGWFSSFGCQVVVGKADKGGFSNHRGPWARFRRAAGLMDDNGDPNKPFLYVLLTGREALIASDLRRKGFTDDPIATAPHQRMRFGSLGEKVKALQSQLGVLDDGDLGSRSAEQLHIKQKALAQGASDGIYTPDLDRALGWGVLGQAGV